MTEPVDHATKKRMTEDVAAILKGRPANPMGGIAMPPCHCENCQHFQFTTQTRLTSLEAVTAILETALKHCAMSPEKRWELQQKLGDLGTSPLVMKCGCYPVEWNSSNKVVQCHQCGRTVPLPALKIVWQEREGVLTFVE